MAISELLDIYDGQGRHVGRKARDEVHKDGDWHRSFHCWLLCRDHNSNECYVILQRRSDNKSSWPGYVDVSAAGHYVAGESIEDGVRELKEEIGVTATLNDLIRVGTRVCVEEFNGKNNHEYQDVFFLWGDADLTKYRLQGEELSGLMKAPISHLLDLFSGKIDELDAAGLQLTVEGGAPTPSVKQYTISREHFIPSLDQYNFKVMILANRIARGDEHLLI